MTLTTIKKYNLSSINNNIELGKRGGMLKYDLVTQTYTFYKSDKLTLAPLEVATATNDNHAITKGQVGDIVKTLTTIPKYNEVTASVSLNVGLKYYLTSNQTLTLPDVSTVSVGDTIVVRSSNAVTSASITVNDTINDAIVTTAGSSVSFTVDTMTEVSFIYAGSNNWELL